MGKFNKLSIIIITLMVCVFGSLIVYLVLFKNNDNVNVNINKKNNINTTPMGKDVVNYLVIDDYCIL